MAKRAYYRHYRPRKLTEVKGQPHVTRTLENAIESGNISHAYLFSGPRGTGKTSVARILAHEINKIPYEDDSTHLDIIEIDAASNRRIDEIRDLRDKIGITPTSSKYKVYIIDEVHMLTKEAFNALLKTLEEPPEHAVFILATTEAHRLPDTILSRTQRHTFKPATTEELSRHLALIAKKEDIEISDDALKLLSKHASGSYRDGLSLLNQLATSHDKKIDLDAVQESLGLAPSELVAAVLTHVEGGETIKLLDELEKLMANGISAPMFAKQIVNKLQSNWAQGLSYAPQMLKLTDGLISVQGASEPEIKMTVVLLEACLHYGHQPAPQPQKHTVKKTVEAAKVAEKLAPKAAAIEMDEVVESKEFDQTAWQNALEKIKASNNSLYAVLRMAHAGLNGSNDVVVLTFQFPFHQKQIALSKNKKIVEDVLSAEVGQTVSLKLVVDKNLNLTPVESNAEPKELDDEKSDEKISSVIDIMGGGEVVSI